MIGIFQCRMMRTGQLSELMRSNWTISFIVLIAVTINSLPNAVQRYTRLLTPIPPTQASNHYHVVTSIDKTDIQIWDSATQSESFFSHLTPDRGMDIEHFQISSDEQVIYFVETPHTEIPRPNGSPFKPILGLSMNFVQFIPATQQRIIPATQQRKTIYQGKDFLTFKLSPDNKQAMIPYYADDGRIIICILDIQSGNCPTYNQAISSFTQGRWVNNQYFVDLANNYQPYLIDTKSGNSHILPSLTFWYVDTLSPIPGTNSLLTDGIKFAQFPDKPVTHFIVYNLSSQTYQLLPYTTDAAQPLDLQFSPDGHYFSYLNSNDQTDVIEFQTGRLTCKLNTLNVQWLPDSSAVVTNTFADSGSSILLLRNPQSCKVNNIITVLGALVAIHKV